MPRPAGRRTGICSAEAEDGSCGARLASHWSETRCGKAVDLVLTNSSNLVPASGRAEFFADDGSPLQVPISAGSGTVETMHSVDVTVPPLGVVVLSTRADGKEFPGKGHLAKFLQELFPEVITTEFEGTLVVRTETSKISAIALELGTQPGEFTTLPVVPIRY